MAEIIGVLIEGRLGKCDIDPIIVETYPVIQ